MWPFKRKPEVLEIKLEPEITAKAGETVILRLKKRLSPGQMVEFKELFDDMAKRTAEQTGVHFVIVTDDFDIERDDTENSYK